MKGDCSCALSVDLVEWSHDSSPVHYLVVYCLITQRTYLPCDLKWADRFLTWQRGKVLVICSLNFDQGPRIFWWMDQFVFQCQPIDLEVQGNSLLFQGTVRLVNADGALTQSGNMLICC